MLFVILSYDFNVTLCKFSFALCDFIVTLYEFAITFCAFIITLYGFVICLCWFTLHYLICSLRFVHFLITSVDISFQYVTKAS